MNASFGHKMQKLKGFKVSIVSDLVKSTLLLDFQRVYIFIINMNVWCKFSTRWIWVYMP